MLESTTDEREAMLHDSCVCLILKCKCKAWVKRSIYDHCSIATIYSNRCYIKLPISLAESGITKSRVNSYKDMACLDALNPHTSCAFAQCRRACYRFLVGAAMPLRVKSIRLNAPPIVLDQSTTRSGWLPALHEEYRSFWWIVRYWERWSVAQHTESDSGGFPFIYVESTLRVSVIVLTQSNLSWRDLSTPSPVWMKLYHHKICRLSHLCMWGLSISVHYFPIAMVIATAALSYYCSSWLSIKSATTSFDSSRNSVISYNNHHFHGVFYSEVYPRSLIWKLALALYMLHYDLVLVLWINCSIKARWLWLEGFGTNV